VRRIAQGELVITSSPDVWDVLDFAETSFSADGTDARREPRMQQDWGFSREMLELSEVAEYLLELPEIGRRIQYLEDRGFDASQYVAAYWGRIASGVSVVLMTMLALPFVLGSLRSVGAGARMIVGLVIGLGYYVMSDLSANTGKVLALDPVVAAWAPSGILLVVTVFAVLRLR
jgi:lipopolysaccharide export system permease protein